MRIFTDTMPPFWWLNPWQTARELFEIGRAMQQLSENDGQLHDFHLRKIYETTDIIRRQGERIRELEAELDRLNGGLDALQEWMEKPLGTPYKPSEDPGEGGGRV